MSNEKTIVVKGELWTLFGDRALTFASWLNDAANPNSVAVRTIFDSVQDINLQGIIFNQVLQILLAESVITSVQMDAIASRITSLPSFGTE